MTFRAQLQGFFFGFAVVGGVAMYQLQKDMWSSHRMIMASVRHACGMAHTCAHMYLLRKQGLLDCLQNFH